MLIEHETAPSIAWKVLRTGVFRGGPVSGDAGLNAVISGGVGYWSGQRNWPGAIMTFEWSGPMVNETTLYSMVDTLYDQKPHRVFVPVGTTKYLALRDIRLLPDYSWDECVEKINFPSGLGIFTLPKWIKAIRSRTKSNIQQQIRHIEATVAELASSPKTVVVGASLE